MLLVAWLAIQDVVLSVQEHAIKDTLYIMESLVDSSVTALIILNVNMLRNKSQNLNLLKKKLIYSLDLIRVLLNRLNQTKEAFNSAATSLEKIRLSNPVKSDN